jgi:hypothetical protein
MEVARVTARLKRTRSQVRSLRLLAKQQNQTIKRLERRFRELRGMVLGLHSARVSGEGAAHFSPKGVYALRSQLGMTRVRFAQALGVSPGSIFGWEHGRSLPRGRNIMRLQELQRCNRQATPKHRARRPSRRRAR